MIIKPDSIVVNIYRSNSKTVFWHPFIKPDYEHYLLSVNFDYRARHGWEAHIFSLSREGATGYMRRPEFVLRRWSYKDLMPKLNALLYDDAVVKYIFDNLWRQHGR